MNDNNSIFISAGDPSADFPGKNLITELRRLCPDFEIFGLGGPLMQKAGLEPLAEYKKLAVMGFWEVLPKIVFFKRLLNVVVGEISIRKPKAVILIDYPGFNLRLAERIKHLGLPIIYYISPQVWAWGRRRLEAIKRLVDLMLVIFPFEESFYEENGINAQFVGHPIVDRYGSLPDKKSCRACLDISDNTKLIAILPGSRVQEVKRMLPTMTEAATLLKRKLEHAEFIVAGIENLDRRLYTDILGNSDIPVLLGKTPEIISGADLVITSSGTATIETAYFMTPMVVVYKTGALTYRIARRLVTLDSIGMVNIVAGRRVVPELIQKEASAGAVASHALDIIENRDIYDKMLTELKAVREKLGAGDSARRAAEAIQKAVTLC